MKRISFLLLVLLTSLSATYAQMSVAINYKSQEDRLAKSNTTIQDEKKAVLAKTWIDRAKLLQEIADCHMQYLRAGMTPNEARIFFKEPKEQKTYPDGREEYVYERFSLTFEGSKLKYWVETQQILPSSLDDAVLAYKKAKELDVENKNGKKITEGLKLLRDIYNKSALNSFYQKDYVSAYKSFDNYVKLGDIKDVSTGIDTVFIYYTGVTAQSALMYDEAIQYLNRAKALKYNEPLIYTALKDCYLAKGDSISALASLKEGLQAYPNRVEILIDVINYYLIVNESDKALEFLQKAKDQDPSNKSYYYVEGTLYDKMGKTAESVTAYKKAIAMDSTYFDAYYNLGVLYYNNGIKLTENANNEPDNRKYAEKKKIADDEFLNVIPYMERAYTIIAEAPLSTDDAINKSNIENKKATLETLKTLYYRLKMNDQLDRVSKLMQELQPQ